MPSHTKKYLGVAASLFLVGLLCTHGVTGIINITAHAAGQADNVDMYTTAAQAMGMGITFMQFLMHVLLKLMDVLIDPNFFLQISGPSNGQEVLLRLWRFSRDLMNVLFAVMLIGSAMYMVVTGDSENAKGKMPRFVIGIILVNFSFFFPRVILDVANVTAASIYQIPIVMGDNFTNCQVTAYQCIEDQPPTPIYKPCKEITQVYVFDKADNPGTPPAGSTLEPPILHSQLRLATKTYTRADNRQRIFYGLVYNLGKLQDLNKIVPAPANNNNPNNFSDMMEDLMFFILNTMFIFSLHTMLFFPLLAMLSAFVVRIIVLWLTIAFMPFMFLSFVTGSDIPVISNTMQIFTHFVKAAFLPAVFAIPLTLGFVMINEITKIRPPAEYMEQLGLCTGTLVSGVGTWWQLLFLVVTYFVIWKGFTMTLEKYDEIYAKAGNWAISLGKNLGGIVAKSPLLAPIIPTPTGFKTAAEMNPLGRAERKNADLNRQMRGGGGATSDDALNKKASMVGADGTRIHDDLRNILRELKKDLDKGDPAAKDTALRSAERLPGLGIQSVDEMIDISRRVPTLEKEARDAENALRKK